MNKWRATRDVGGTWHFEEEPEITFEGFIITTITIIILFLLFAITLKVDEAQTERRKLSEQKEMEAKMAISASIWDLDIIESDAIYGNQTNHDSYGNAYAGEYREFCAWKTTRSTHEPFIIVDIDEKYEYKRFTGTIFTRPNQDEDLAITFKIFADGKCIFNSGEMHTTTKATNLNLDVTGVDKLKFIAFTNDYNAYCNPAVILVNAVLHAE